MPDIHEDLSRSHQVKGSSNRSFGWVMTAVFLIVALWPLVSGGTLRWWSLIIGGLIFLITVAAPTLLTLPNRLWLRFGLLLNRIISPVVLGFLYYVVVTPTGMLMRLFGKDNLRIRRDNSDRSYWIKRDPPGPKPDSLHNQF